MIGRYDAIGVLHELRYRRRRKRPAEPPYVRADATPLVSVVCVTNRPRQVDNVIYWFEQQTWIDKELVVVANCKDYPRDRLSTSAKGCFIELPAEHSLGECLNVGFARANGEIIVRFDDDDSYAPDFLASVVNTFQTVAADVIGKQDHFAYVESLDAIVQLFKGRSDQFVGRVAGGTIAVLATHVAAIRFPHINLGEDIAYLRRCERAGLRIWGTPPNGYLQHRRAAQDHTWKIDDETFTRYSQLVTNGLMDEAWM